ncbi:MAG: hypothetical protein DWQ37_10515 [Planctomycetota bacterium]|nr:MAG: hypothetical protein DWQ37_10515 [Planctomycetota bacterium]
MRCSTRVGALGALVLLFQFASAHAAERILLASAEAADSAGVISLTNQSSFLDEDAATTNWVDDEVVYEPRPRWTVWAGAIFLQRSEPARTGLIFNGPNTLFNAGDLNFGTAAGPDINAIRHGEVFDVDFRYFQVMNMGAHERIFPPGASNIGLGSPYNLNVLQIDVNALTSIQSAEINLRKNITPNISLLAGFRYLSLDDHIKHQYEVLGLSETLGVFTVNQLYGAQAGFDANVFTWGRFQLQTAAKGGIYGNAARNEIRVRSFGVLDSSIGAREQQTTFVGDWNFNGIFQINDIWAIRGGYQLLWVSGVALSTDQFTLADLVTPGVQIDSTGDLFLHGALVSIQAGW